METTKITHAMTNDELQIAICKTSEMIADHPQASQIYKELCSHLGSLLQTQARRASVAVLPELAPK